MEYDLGPDEGWNTLDQDREVEELNISFCEARGGRVENNDARGFHAMLIRFSRHAKRTDALYGIPESAVTKTLNKSNLSQGTREMVVDVEGFRYPIKIVVAVEGGTVTVITNY